MANHFRTDRVGMEIKREVNEILQKKVRDPRVQGVTITDVQMLGDLSVAKVYYTILSNLASDNQKAQIGLEKATGTIKRELGRNLKLYKIPDLTFVKDESIEYGNKIDEMLRNLHKNSRRGVTLFFGICQSSLWYNISSKIILYSLKIQTASTSPWIIYVTDFVSLIYNLKTVF